MTTRDENPESLTDSARFHEARGLADRLASESVDVPAPSRAREQQPDDRTTAEWIADLVKARQAADAEAERLNVRVELAERMYFQVHSERDELRATVARIEALHSPVEVEPSETICAACSTQRGSGDTLRYFPYVDWPCATIGALAGGVAAAAPTSSDGGA